MKKEAMAESYGGDGTVLGSAKAETFFGHTMAGLTCCVAGFLRLSRQGGGQSRHEDQGEGQENGLLLGGEEWRSGCPRDPRP